MNIFARIVSAVVICTTINNNGIYCSSLQFSELKYTINKTWDNHTTEDNAQVKISFQIVDNYLPDKRGLLINIDAPFYDDPSISDKTPTDQPTLGLWNYEVVEVFFLGNEQEYLEIELGPKGHYILLLLKGQQNLITYQLPLTNYTSSYSSVSGRWIGEAYIPGEYFPCNITQFNAYAIHNSDPNRVYMSLFPVPTNKYSYPDFHRMEAFEPINLGSEINPTSKCMLAHSL